MSAPQPDTETLVATRELKQALIFALTFLGNYEPPNRLAVVCRALLAEHDRADALAARLAEAEARAERVATLEAALRDMLELVDRHEQWCGFNKDSPGDSIINRAPERARAALVSASSQPAQGDERE